MPFWNNILNWVGNAGRNFVSGAKKVGNKVGQAINYIGNGVEGVYGKVKRIPVFGNIIGNSPIGQTIEKGINIARHAGRALQGQESFSEAIPEIVKSVTGFSPSDLIFNYNKAPAGDSYGFVNGGAGQVPELVRNAPQRIIHRSASDILSSII